MKKEREYIHLMHFKEKCSFFPIGEVECSESPDFIVNTPNGLLGIEHTKILQPGPPHGGSLQAQESLQQRIVEKAKLQFIQNGGSNLKVKVCFRDETKIKKHEVPNIAQSLCDLVNRYIPSRGEHVMLEPTYFTWKDFPTEINFIQIHHSLNDSDACWNYFPVGWIPSLTVLDIQKIIIDKEEKLATYKEKCAEVWLLIVSAEFHISAAVDLTDEAIEHCYRTGFDRIFIYWDFGGSFVELKKEIGDNE